jgi:hypothetical protein
MKNRIASAVAVSVIAVATMLGGAASASATDPDDAPAGYAGPFSSCSGDLVYHIPLSGTSGYINVWYSPAGSGTFCAMTFDNLAGSHHIEVILRHEDWQTPWYDSGTYSTFAGGIYVSGMNTRCAYVWGRVVVNGVDYNNGWDYIC